MFEFAVDCFSNALPFQDPTVQVPALSKELAPGSYTVRISGGAYSPFANGDDAEPSIMLWFLHDHPSRVPRHRDRSTNVFTHSQFRSLAGLGDAVSIDVYLPTFMYAFWFDENGADNSGIVELTIEHAGGRETIDVDAAQHSVTWSPAPSLNHEPATIKLERGTHILRIESGEWSFFPTGAAAEPFVMLWVAGGRQKDLKTGIETPLTVRTLNGYGDTLMLEVIEPTELKAFFLDSDPSDNAGSVHVRVLEPKEEAPLAALIIDGQSEHNTWKGISARLKAYLRQTGLFRVDHMRTTAYLTPQRLLPNFSNYDVVLLNYSSQIKKDDFDSSHPLRRWPPAVEAAFEEYVNSGGGVVIVHSANNSFPYWEEYNQITGLGGWYGRNAEWGPYVYYQEEAGQFVLKRDPAPDNQLCGGHPVPPRPYAVDVRTDHPITAGLPPRWMHDTDELYSLLRGPAQNMEVLCTGFADPAWGWDGQKPSEKPTGRHEPLLMTIRYGQGRVFHTALGHTDANKPEVMYRSMECVGFITTFQRGAEWAATGSVTQAVPGDFPTADSTRSRPFAG